MNSISSLTTPRNLEIISIISKEELSIRGIAERIRCSPGTVHHAVKLFKEYDIAKTRKDRNQVLVKPNRENPVYQAIKSSINMWLIQSANTFHELVKVGVIGIYGSYARGTDDAQSDIDLLIVTEKKEMEIREQIRKMEDELGRTINLLVITKKNLHKLEEKDKPFYIRLKFTTRTFNGDPFE